MKKEPSIYKQYSADQIEEINSNYLISSWGYSKVTSFARNEKGFEMNYIFGIHSKSSATTIAGQAYHEALRYYFAEKREGKIADVVDLEAVAFEHINSTPGNYWKLQKTTPTVDEAITKASQTVSALIKNFIREKGVYEDFIKEVIAVEVSCSEYLSINGVDIPIPCHGRIDLVILTNDDKIVIIDHKSKNAYTPEDEISLSIGVQAITYINLYEQYSGNTVDEIWFVENKYSQNKDGSPQVRANKLVIDDNTRKLYESLLYEPLRRMIEAVSDPNHVYIINDSDMFIDRAEMYEFWCKTMIAEIDEFNVDRDKKELISKRLKKIRDSSSQMISPVIIRNFKENASQFIQYDLSNKNMTYKEKIEHVLRTFGIIVNVAHIFEGYSSSTYLLEISAGVKISSIFPKRLDIANALDVSNVRIANELAVYEGRSYVAIDFPKRRDETLAFDPSFLKGYRIPLGKDNFGNIVYWDLQNQSTPHALICGATGSGKSVCIKNIIEYCMIAKMDDIIILDPKFEFANQYSRNKNIEVISDIELIEERVSSLVDYMNELVKSGTSKRTLVVFDEFADAFANSKKGKGLEVREAVMVGNYANGNPKIQERVTGKINSLEDNLRILLQKGRSSGFRIVAATQRASTKIITGDAKVNFPVQICFRVPKEADSRVVLDEAGAESLAGRGDGLIKSPEYSDTKRFQAFFKGN